MNRHVVFSQVLADPGTDEMERQRRWQAVGAIGWYRSLLVSDPLPHLAVPTAVAFETVTSADYICGGLHRRGETGCFLQLVLAGSGCCRVRGREQVWSPGWALAGRCDDPAQAWWLPADAPSWTVLALFFRGAAAEAALAALPGGPLLRPLSPGHPSVQWLLALDRHPILHIHLAGREAARLVLDLIAGLEPIPAEPGDDLADRALAALASDPSVSVAHLAQALTVSREHLSRTVRRRLGIDLRQLLARERLMLAERLAAAGELPAKVIARRCGFASASSLARARRHSRR